ncbi:MULTISPECIES: nicotinate (nicotinamide) nucleotide adenylyltransferase [Tenacibaculum]|uniref:nicotinate (nicotinamide) nucleotide adenylyltransferase n=1 Tax=Tenacibaculum TaxID=104267 RepID=UPI001F4867E3|nr:MULTISPECIES: nicotinate (nicotinamide) nucleotide adenylyltransferase [Tenacibaculum]MCF2874490.1 nicotinate-nucleotide adenylyltransferase [Tenacibaculum sp. Cn5-1]MCF2934444.1 nicotinate-nucleotide adenylyltransferase [Tenacibaculum sp. Cn5-34]MCG7510654.1 nicotinate-nucleotide adenylyltransferase [Tenacibaculum sp. Cn5-46]
MKNIGLYFGTFNPIHIGHLIIANHMVENSDLDEIWMVVTPHNPFKKKSSLLDNHHRLEMVYLATKEYDKIKPSDIEFNLPQPNYTINTLAHITEKYPDYNFNLIMGEDNLKSFHKWKNYEAILDDYNIYVYPRISEGIVENEFLENSKIHRVDAPIVQISSTMIRNGIKAKKNMKPLLSTEVWTYVDEMNFYKK